MKWQFIVTWGWWRPKHRSATQSREEVGEVNNQDELLKRRVAETINIPAKGFSTHSESSSLGGKEFGIVESSRR